MLWRWLYSIGISEGSFPALVGLDVDHAIVWADPHATPDIFFPLEQRILTLTVRSVTDFYQGFTGRATCSKSLRRLLEKYDTTRYDFSYKKK